MASVVACVKDIYTDEEVSDLVAMYKHPERPRSVMDLLQQVRNTTVADAVRAQIDLLNA